VTLQEGRARDWLRLPDTAEPAPPSPCVNVCRLDEARVYCIGCHRSRDEIRAWREADPVTKRAILASAATRAAQLA